MRASRSLTVRPALPGSNRAWADQADVPGATNHVAAALGELMAGKAVSVKSSQPYGCSVKYAN